MRSPLPCWGCSGGPALAQEGAQVDRYENSCGYNADMVHVQTPGGTKTVVCQGTYPSFGETDVANPADNPTCDSFGTTTQTTVAVAPTSGRLTQICQFNPSDQ